MSVTKIAIFLCLSVVIVSAMPQLGAPTLGGVKQLDAKKAEEVLNRSLTKLAAGDGPYYSIAKIYSATEQVVAGTSHKIVADLVERNGGKTKKCNISIWSREWLPNGIEISFECPNEPKLTKTHSA